MKNIINVIVNEIRQGENIDLYVTILLALVVAILGIFQVAKFDVVAGAILATLALLASAMLSSRRATRDMKLANNKLQETMDDLKLQLEQPAYISDLILQGYPDFASQLQSAKRVSVLGAVLSSTVSRYNSEFVRILNRGGTLRFVLSEPTPEVFAMQSVRSSLVDDYNFMMNASQNAMKTILTLAEKNSLGLVELQTIPYLNPYNLIIIESADGIAKIYVRLMAFQTSASEQPVLEFDKKNDTDWYRFFEDQFEKIWSSSNQLKRENLEDKIEYWKQQLSY